MASEVSYLALALRNMTVHTHQRFVGVLRKSSQCISQFVHRCHRERRNEREEADSLIPLYLGVEGVRRFYYSGVGVGVYQGRFVVILRWAPSRPQWIIDKLRTPDFHLLEKELVYKLLKLVVICARHLLSDVPMMDLKKQNEIARWKYCPRRPKPEQTEVSSSKGDVNATCPLLYQLLEQLKQSSQECPIDCPFMKIVNQEYGSVNQSGKEPIFLCC